MTNELQIIRNDYNKLSNLPKINGVELKGNKTAEELGIGGAPTAKILNSTIAWDTTEYEEEGANPYPGTIANEEDAAQIESLYYDLADGGKTGSVILKVSEKQGTGPFAPTVITYFTLEVYAASSNVLYCIWKKFDGTTYQTISTTVRFRISNTGAVTYSSRPIE